MQQEVNFGSMGNHLFFSSNLRNLLLYNMKQNGSFNDPTSSSAAVQMRILPSASSDASIGLKLDPQQAHLPDLKRRKRGTSTLVQGMDQNTWESLMGAR
jgi:hypothetical protein